MAITRVAGGAINLNFSDSSSPWTTSVDVSGGTGKIAVFLFTSLTQALTALSYGGVTGSKAHSGTVGSTNIEIWYVPDPPSGSNTLSISWASGSQTGAAVSYRTIDGADTSSPVGNTASSTGTTSTNATYSITTASANSIIFYCHTSVNFLAVSHTPAASHNEISDGAGAANLYHTAGDRIVTTATSYTTGCTISPSVFLWGSAAVEFKEASGGDVTVAPVAASAVAGVVAPTYVGPVSVAPSAASAVAGGVDPTVDIPANYETIVYVGNGSDNADNTSTCVVTHGLTINEDDLVLALVCSDGASSASVPTGFTEIRNQTILSENLISSYKVAGASEPSTYTFNFSPGERAWCCIAVYRNVDTTSPVDSSNQNSTTTDGTSATFTSLTPTTDGCAVIALIGTEEGSKTFSAWPATLTERNDNTNGPPGSGAASASGGFADVIQTDAAAVSGTVTISDATSWMTQVIALKPAPTSSGVTVTPPAASAVAGKVDPTFVAGPLSLTPAAVSAVAGKVDPVFVAGALSITPAASSAVGATVDPTVAFSVAFSPAAASAIGGTVAPAVVQGAITVTAPSASAVGASVAPTTVLGSLLVAPGAGSAVGGVSAPSVTLGALTVAPSAASAVATVVAPAVEFGATTATPTPASVVAGVAQPTADTGGNISITPAAVVGIAGIVAPTVVLGSVVVTPQAANSVAGTVSPVVVDGEPEEEGPPSYTAGWEAYARRQRAKRAREEAERLAQQAPSKRKRRAQRIYRIAVQSPETIERAVEAVAPYVEPQSRTDGQVAPFVSQIDWDALARDQVALEALLVAMEVERDGDDAIVALLMAS